MYARNHAYQGPGNKRGRNPQTDDAHHSGKAPDQVAAPKKKEERQGQRNQTEGGNPKAAHDLAEQRGFHSRGKTPKAQKPVPLR